jgi:Membrane proteins related to metalloendopeptidases
MSKTHFKTGLRLKRVLACFLCFYFLASSIGANAVEVVEAPKSDAISKTQAQIDALKEEQAALDSKLAALKDDETKSLEYQKTLEEKILNVQDQIDQVRTEISTLDKDITVLNKKIKKSEAELSDTLELFYDRVKTLYTSGSSAQLSTLEILLNSSTLHEFSMKNEMLKSLDRRNDKVMEIIEQYLEDTAEERTERQTKKDRVAALKLEYEQNQLELEKMNEENNAYLSSIKDLTAEAQRKRRENEEQSTELLTILEEEIEKARIAEEEARKKKAEEERLAAQAAKAAAKAAAAAKKAAEKAQQQQQQNNNNNNNAAENNTAPEDDYSDPVVEEPDDSGSNEPDQNYGGGFNPCWPMPGVTYVSQYFGGSNGHMGIDIAGPYGSRIVATESGKVIVANSSDSWGSGWGYYVLLYHNDTYSTRYAHMSSLAVSPGQYVSKGQVIGYEGNTGNSSGPHLHYEVLKYGSRVNPWPYIGG